MSGPTVKSPDYYYARGDLVLQVENVLFRIHRDIISAHSSFFQDMFHTESSDKQEGESDDRPLKLSKDLCSVDSFTILCKLLYPKKICVLPTVLVGELDIWAPALEATQALQMDGAREYILSRFEEDRMNIPSVAARLLGIITNYEETSDALKLECIHSLVIRRGPILTYEACMLGSETMAHISIIRDRVRTLAASRSWVAIPRHPLCKGELESSCQFAIHAGVLANLRLDPVKLFSGNQGDSMLSIFDIPRDERVCRHCDSVRMDLACTGIGGVGLYEEIRRCALGLKLLKGGD
ncbi:hypothetical protein RSOLAG1IB_09692 [Rhizoctonia solani AG-1 IB]|uniref:BTB domain-containing protein n=1 Tax=Thanatephorus cucumeris (strain AG1-IB / isolate 7/3/14) TaxID=1108050 RepID=A0A0B7FUF3_THACB|nr:hypothetical protein RSOLAG1IB_09692 [Rhizoctonia solani AG-1 IB]